MAEMTPAEKQITQLYAGMFGRAAMHDIGLMV